MEDATRDALMSAGLIEKSGDTFRMPSAVHKAWFVTLAASEIEDDDGGEE
ncbi:hypothetical protein [Acetobacter persici]|nr:hypothetical protein [Acetobacter persici]